jgi:hypothetical protein
MAVALQNAPSLAAWIDGITDLDSGNFAWATGAARADAV